ncbi:alpha/beta hydrolase family protein [Paenibacillus glacialis]|uniref:Alpha/beta hydrolase n=1 Tax=Paenibacillus glacialis TaxID=494026 RepID=A0A168NX34_9BACL|nr:alpha/beta hydrolase [Paenibacillus glacialis]OAB46179.1 hypothetical protein PGLA_01990 [Paenibacillus glacialis]
MELETTIYTPLKPSFRSRMRLRIKATFALDTRFWRIAQSGVWASFCLIFALTSLSMPTGLGTSLDIFLSITAGTIGLAISATLLALLLSLIGLPIPRLFTGGVLFELIAIYFMFWIPGSGIAVSIASSVIVTLLGVLLGCWMALIASQHIKTRTKWLFSITLCMLSSIIIGFIDREKSDVTQMYSISDRNVSTIPLSSPADPGVFKTKYFTYGSGYDIHRKEYGPKAELKSTSVDASSYIDKWPWLRSLFWGFDQKALPLNGRVWMPSGNGPFPLVLMVHGNHLMEDYSDEGYGYLGELLASRGFIAISVDENFLNYSVWSNIPDNDIKIRTWLLLKHLQQIQTFSEQSESPFYNNVNFDQIALIGHSRGGQAVAMAADSDRWFRSDLDLKKDLKHFSIKAVVALAPTDTMVDGMQAKLRNVSYMVLQGSRDGDLNEYFGERQYARSSFTPDDKGFKTYLHIPNANHSQFNTSWGGLDISLPKGLLLNQSQLMTASDQQQIAKVYVSAFLETILHESQDYNPLFRDYRTGRDWLPESIYYNRFEDGNFIALARYDEDKDRTTLLNNGTADASKGLRWTEESSTPQNKSVLLENSEHHAQESSYSLSWDEDDVLDQFTEADGLSLSIADQSMEGALKQGDLLPISEMEITLETSDAVSVTLPLSQFMTLQPMIIPRFTKSPWLEKHFDDGNYNLPEKAIFQTVELPFEVFQEANSIFVPANINRITLNFSNGPSKTILDDVGLYRN